jgi:adenine-specific DNA methylase
VVSYSGESQATRDFLALSLSRFTDIFNALCQWENTKNQVRHLFTRQALPMLWDFAEPGLFGEQAGDFSVTLGTMLNVVEAAPLLAESAVIQSADASNHPLPADSAPVWFTDPPYYDAVPYADLSDFFFVWLRRALPDHPLLRNPFEPGNPLTPKCPEIVQDEVKHTPDGRAKDKAFFEQSMLKAFTEGRRILKDDGVGAVVFAHKTTEGWEALISGMLQGGWMVTGSWPVTTEMATRLRARESAALAASVHLICRRRASNAGVGGWEDILRELPNRIVQWMERLSGEGIRGAELVFSCIGPALELFSKYEHVETAEGRRVELAEFLEKVWEVVGRTALQQVLGTA